MRRWAALLAVLVGCYNPIAREGAPCDTTDQCPSPQRCVLGMCATHDPPPPDAPAPPPPDAMPDAAPPPDAMRLACSIAGLSCAGTATMFSCGGNCWVRCTANVPRDTARAACETWMGVLGEIDDPTEQGCVGPQAVAPTWIGLTQASTATSPGDAWTWNNTRPLTFTNWISGKPDDGDRNESRAEQCASMRAGGGWDDDSCNTAEDFMCERPQ